MGLLNIWIDSKLAELAHESPDGFELAYSTGYMHALLELEYQLQIIKQTLPNFEFDMVYQTHEQIINEMNI